MMFGRGAVSFGGILVKVSMAMHEAAMSAGGVVIPPTSVIYKHAGKMYMFDYQDAANTQTAINFQSQFDDD